MSLLSLRTKRKSNETFRRFSTASRDPCLNQISRERKHEQGHHARMTEQAAREFLSRVNDVFQTKPFQPHRLFAGGHAQTLAAFAWPHRYRYEPVSDQERLFEVAPGVRVLAHCRWQPSPTDHPTLVLWHGIEGSTSSGYMPSTAAKAFR